MAGIIKCARCKSEVKDKIYYRYQNKNYHELCAMDLAHELTPPILFEKVNNTITAEFIFGEFKAKFEIPEAKLIYEVPITDVRSGIKAGDLISEDNYLDMHVLVFERVATKIIETKKGKKEIYIYRARNIECPIENKINEELAELRDKNKMADELKNG